MSETQNNTRVILGHHPLDKDFHFAVIGDIHGQFQAALDLVREQEQKHGVRVDCGFCVGDFESHRNPEDLATMAAPAEHRKLGDFWKFHQGQLTFPFPILACGGNHEAYGWLEEDFPEGGELCPGFWYSGRVGWWLVGPLKVLALSGIYRQEDFQSPRPPAHLFSYKSNRCWIGFNQQDLDMSSTLINHEDDQSRPDLFLTHDWPAGMAQ